MGILIVTSADHVSLASRSEPHPSCVHESYASSITYVMLLFARTPYICDDIILLARVLALTHLALIEAACKHGAWEPSACMFVNRTELAVGRTPKFGSR
jgi:hypothetical protein